MEVGGIDSAKICLSDGSERQALTYPGSAPAAFSSRVDCGVSRRGYSAHSQQHTDIGAILLDGRHAIAFLVPSLHRIDFAG